MGNDKSYSIHIYDQDESTRIAVLENAFNISFTRELSKPIQISFQLPNTDEKLDETFTDSQSVSRPIIDIGNVIKLYDEGNSVIAAGIIIGPLDITKNPVDVTAIGLAGKLDRYRTPILFNYNDAPANILREILKEHRFQRRNTNADFDAGTFTQTQRIDLGGTDSGEEGGAVILGSDGGTPPESPYYTSGDWTSATIDMGTGLTAWRKIKFKAGINEKGTLTFQTRASTDGSTWDAWTSAVGIDAFCEDGYPITSTVKRYIQVKLNFTTDDTEFTPIVQALEVQGTYGDILSEGTGFGDLPTDAVSINPSYEPHLKLLNTFINEQGEYDATTGYWEPFEWEETTAGAINIGAPLGSDLSAQYTFHEYQHFEMLEYEEDDVDLGNYVIGLGTGAGLNQLLATSEYTNSQDRYGKRTVLYEKATEKTSSGLLNVADGYINEYKDTKKFIRILLIDTSDETWDFKVGDTIRIISPNRSIDAELRIMSETRQFTQDGFSAELTLTNPVQAKKSFAVEYLQEQSEFALAADSALKNYESGDLWTDWIGASDTAWKQIIIKLGFTPTDGHIMPIQVLEDVTGYYTQPGTQIDYRVSDLRTGEMEFEYRRIDAGTNQIRIQFLWKAWSRRRTFSSIGLGGQIS